jgi:Arc/MetJ-type ribon-helix-helix transcriptional regulator
MSKETIETIPVSTRITRPMRQAISNVLQVNAHINVADYLRDLIRKDLESRGVKIEEAKP